MFNAGLAVAVAALGAFAVAIGARLLVLQWRMGREGPPRLPPPRAELRRSLARERAPEGGIGRPPTPEPVGVTGAPGCRYRGTAGSTQGHEPPWHG
jgi:hypothetical protein